MPLTGLAAAGDVIVYSFLTGAAFFGREMSVPRFVALDVNRTLQAAAKTIAP